MFVQGSSEKSPQRRVRPWTGPMPPRGSLIRSTAPPTLSTAFHRPVCVSVSPSVNRYIYIYICIYGIALLFNPRQELFTEGLPKGNTGSLCRVKKKNSKCVYFPEFPNLSSCIPCAWLCKSGVKLCHLIVIIRNVKQVFIYIYFFDYWMNMHYIKIQKLMHLSGMFLLFVKKFFYRSVILQGLFAIILLIAYFKV